MTATPVWTDTTVRLLGCAVALIGCGLLAGADTPTIALTCAVAGVVCCLVAVRFDAFIGLAVGVLAAAAPVIVRIVTGGWGDATAVLVAAQTVALVALGWLAGSLGGRLRAVAASASADQGGSFQAVHNSLGLLGFDQAMTRLDEEIARSRGAHTPLCLLCKFLLDGQILLCIPAVTLQNPDSVKASCFVFISPVSTPADLFRIPPKTRFLPKTNLPDTFW